MQFSIFVSVSFIIIVHFINVVLPYRFFYLDDFSPNSSSSVISLETRSKSAVILRGFKDETYAKNEANFKVTVTAPKANGIVLSFFRVHFPNECGSTEEVKFESSDKNITLCDKFKEKNSRKQSSEIFHAKNVTVSFEVKKPTTLSFDFTLTAFIEKKCWGDFAFNCDNRICIWSGLMCDDRNNCGNNHDENMIYTCTYRRSYHGADLIGLIILGTIAVLMVVGISCAVFRVIAVNNQMYREPLTVEVQPIPPPYFPGPPNSPPGEVPASEPRRTNTPDSTTSGNADKTSAISPDTTKKNEVQLQPGSDPNSPQTSRLQPAVVSSPTSDQQSPTKTSDSKTLEKPDETSAPSPDTIKKEVPTAPGSHPNIPQSPQLQPSPIPASKSGPSDSSTTKSTDSTPLEKTNTTSTPSPDVNEKQAPIEPSSDSTHLEKNNTNSAPSTDVNEKQVPTAPGSDSTFPESSTSSKKSNLKTSEKLDKQDRP